MTRNIHTIFTYTTSILTLPSPSPSITLLIKYEVFCQRYMDRGLCSGFSWLQSKMWHAISNNGSKYEHSHTLTGSKLNRIRDHDPGEW